MNLFGLGVTVNYEDNATAGLIKTEEAFRNMNNSADEMVNSMNSKSQAMQELATTGASYVYTGKQMMNMGGGVINTFKDMGMEIVNTGADFENTRVTLEALYKSKELAEEKLKWAVDFGAKTPFDIADVKGLMVGMKAAGVEIDQEVTSVGGHTQELLGYIGDLAALRPDVGMAKMGYAIRNALGGNVKSLVAALDVDVNSLIGRKFGKGGADEVAQDIADLVEAMGAEGLMEKLFGTWGQMLSELSDQMDRIKIAVADAGAFDSAKALLKEVFDLMAGISDWEIAKIGENLNDIFTTLFKPVEFVVRGLVKMGEALKKLIIYHPEIAKLVLGFTLFASVALVALGALTVLMGMVLITISVFGRMGIALKALSGKIALIQFGPMIAGMALFVAKIALAIVVVKALWSILGDDIKKVGRSFGSAFKIMTGDYADFILGLQNLENNDSLFGGLVLGLVKTGIFFKAMIESWNEDELSLDTFNKARKLGILPLIESMIELKNKAKDVWKGFKKGLRDTLETAIDVAKGIGKAFKSIWETLEKVGEYVKPLGDNLKKLSEWVGKKFDTNSYEKLGEVLGKIVGVFLVGGLIVKIVKLGTSLIGLASPIFKVVGAIGKLAFTHPIIAGIGLAILLVIRYWDEIKEVVGRVVDFIITKIDEWSTWFVESIDKMKTGFTEKWGAIKEFFSTTIESIKTGFMEKWNAIGEFFSKITEALTKSFVDNWTKVGEFFSKIWERMKEIVEGVMLVIEGIIDIGVAIVTGIFQLAIDIISGLWEGLVTTVQWVVDKFMSVWNPISEWFSEMWGKIVDYAVEKWDNFVDNMSSIVGWIKEKWQPIREWFADMWNTIVDFALSVWDNFLNGIRVIYDTFMLIWNPIVEFFSAVWTKVKEYATLAWEGIMNVVTGVIEGLKTTLQTMLDFAISVWNIIKEVASIVWEGIMSIVSIVVAQVTNVLTIMGTAITSIWNSIKEVASTVWEMILSVVRVVVEGITNILTTMGSIIDGIWNTIKAGAELLWTSVSGFASTAVGVVETAWGKVVGVFDGIWSGITSGAQVMFGWLEEKFGWVASMIGNIKDTMGNIGGGLSKGWDKIKDGGRKIIGKPPQKMNTGGFVKGEGVAHLHPNEIVINDILTRRLGSFLSKEEANSNGVKPKMNVFPVERREEPTNEPKRLLVNNYYGNNEETKKEEVVNVDNSINIEKGAIAVTMTNGSEEEVEDLANKLWKKIKDLQEIEDIMNYKPI